MRRSNGNVRLHLLSIDVSMLFLRGQSTDMLTTLDRIFADRIFMLIDLQLVTMLCIRTQTQYDNSNRDNDAR